MKKYNIIHIVVDANRYHSNSGDEKDRLPIYNKVRQDGFIEFEKMIVSAPSSIMSAMTMFTSIASFKLSSNYGDFKVDHDMYYNFIDELKSIGYESLAVLNSKELRDKFKTLFNPIEQKNLPSDVKYYQYAWKNKQLNSITENMLDAGVFNNQPFYLMMWYNSRYDYETSQTVEEMLERFKKEDFYEDSIVILTADHGYPDRTRGLTSDSTDMKKAGLSHDMILTDDNICVPFSIKFPDEMNIQPTKEMLDKLYNIAIPQSSIFNTFKEIMNLNIKNDRTFKFEGKSLLSLLENIEDRYWYDTPFRCDARFIFQPNRIASLRTKNYKYIYNYENHKEEFYDLVNDSLETTNLIESIKYSDALQNFRDKMQESETEVISNWSNVLGAKINSILNNSKIFESQKIDILFAGETLFIISFYQKLQELGKDITIYTINNKVKERLLGYIDDNNAVKVLDKGQKLGYKCVLEDTRNQKYIYKILEYKDSIDEIIDVHFDIYNSPTKFKYQILFQKLMHPFRNMYYRRALYKNEPMYFFEDLMQIFINGLMKIKKRVV